MSDVSGSANEKAATGDGDVVAGIAGVVSAKSVPIPPTKAAMAELTDGELSGLASAVVKEQHRRAGADGRRARTQAARQATRRHRSEEEKRAQTSAATAARRAKRSPPTT